MQTNKNGTNKLKIIQVIISKIKLKHENMKKINFYIYKFLLQFIVGFVMCFLVCLYFSKALSQKYILPIELSQRQKTDLNISIEEICKIDLFVCNQFSLKRDKINFKTIPFDRFFHLTDIFSMNKYAITHQSDGKYEILIADTVYNSHIALTIFLYHELQHALFGQYINIAGPQDMYPACIEHNEVKLNTTKFAHKYQMYLESNMLKFNYFNSPTFISNLSGNTPRDCIAEKI